MIESLGHRSESVANEIYSIFQASYRIEAGLVGSDDFPPLRRSASVETATANGPALKLYGNFGFAESRRWHTNDGIEKVQLLIAGQAYSK